MRAAPTTVVCFLAVIAAGFASAQEIPGTFEFSFSNPGARSLGLGGAFSGLADDATAAFANPAGLVQLVEPEVSIEGRHWSYKTPFIEGGRYVGSPTGLGLDTDPGLRASESTEDIEGISFVSFVYPRPRWAVALYRHQLANFRARTETQGLFGEPPDDFADPRSLDRRWSTSLDIVTTGLSGAHRVHERLSLGIGVVFFDGRLDAPFSRYLPDDLTVDGIFAPNSYRPDRQLVYGDMVFDDTDWGTSAGFHWSPTERWQVGGFYREGPEFDVLFDGRAGPAGTVLDPSIAPDELLIAVITPMRFPDVYGVGVGFRSHDGRFAVGFEWDRVEYSTTFDSFDPTLVGGDPDADLGLQLTADDGDELHLGAEYVFLDAQPVVAVRAGAWLDPDHRYRSITADPEHRALFPAGEDETHLAVGFGLVFEDFQIDVGFDHSDLVDTASLSMIYSF